MCPRRRSLPPLFGVVKSHITITYPYPHNASVEAAVLTLRTTTNSTLHVTRYSHNMHTPRGGSTPLRLTKPHKRISNRIRNKIDVGGSSTPSLFDTRACRVVLSTYGVSFQTNSLIFSLPFLPKLSPCFFFFRVSCFVFHVPSHLTPPSHPILHSYPSHLIAARLGRTYTYIPWDVIHSTLGHFSFSSSMYISTYHHNTHGFHKSCLSTFCFLIFVSSGGLHDNLHAMANFSAGQPQAS
jgi:hypothetical protein